MIIQYLSNLSQGMKVLWCYLLWYVYFACKYFERDVELWLRSLGIAILVGLALNLNAFSSFKGMISKSNKWQAFRFLLSLFAFPAFLFW